MKNLTSGDMKMTQSEIEICIVVGSIFSGLIAGLVYYLVMW